MIALLKGSAGRVGALGLLTFLGVLWPGLLTACEAPSCLDADGDGYGPSCPAGDDCDPDNAARNVNCETMPGPDCEADPQSTGCPCLPGAVSPCQTRAAGIGICTAGRTRCLSGFFGLCEGGIGPETERCNRIDDDCDGHVDEGVSSPCGGCAPSCQGGVWGEVSNPFEATEELRLTHGGELALAQRAQNFGTLWVSNSAEASVSRIDTQSATETARYPSGGLEPSRIAVDYNGDAWILNRAFEGITRLTKIAGSIERCQDRTGDGLRTSSGPEDLLALADEECVLLNIALGENGAVGRAIAIDGDRGLDDISGGNVWVGMHESQQVLQIDGQSGELLQTLPTPGFSPYAATFDPWGVLWMISRDGYLARIDARSFPAQWERLELPLPCYLLYGLAAGRDGRLMMTGFSCDRISRFDPDSGLFETRTVEPSPRAITPDASGRFWFAHSGGWVSEANMEPLGARRTLDLQSEDLSPTQSIGVATDPEGFVWVVSTEGGPEGRGLATQLDPSSEEVIAQVPVGRGPHVQGDLIGDRVRWTSVPQGQANHVFEGCPETSDQPSSATQWQRLHLAADAGSLGRVGIDARHGADRSALDAAVFVPIAELPGAPGPYDLSFPEGGLVEVRVTLVARGASGGPRLSRVGIERRCPGPD